MKVCSIGCLRLIFIAVAGLAAPLRRFLEGAPYNFFEGMNEYSATSSEPFENLPFRQYTITQIQLMRDKCFKK